MFITHAFEYSTVVMLGSNLTYETWLDLFGKGMGLLTVGAACILVGLNGPLSGSPAPLALSIPFLTAGAFIVLLPLVLPIQPIESPSQLPASRQNTVKQTRPTQSVDD